MKTTKLTLPKNLTLDYLKWICGGGLEKESVKNACGVGESNLLNECGLMCCLGQFASQAGVDDKSLQGRLNYDDLYLENDNEIIEFINFDLNDTIHTDAQNINDSSETSIAQKMVALEEVFGEKGFIITFKNFPKEIEDEANAIRNSK